MVKNVLNTLRKKQKNNKGFSLVELIVVIAIMAVLVGVLAPQFIKYVEKSRQSTDMQSVTALKNAVEAEVADKDDAASVTITVKGGNTKEAESSIDLSSTNKKVSLKSKNWPTSIVFELDPSSGKWTTKTAAGGTKALKAPTDDMSEVFQSDSVNTPASGS